MTRGVICANSESAVRMGWQAPFNIPNRVRLATVKRSLLLCPYSLGGLERRVLNSEAGVRIPLGTPI